MMRRYLGLLVALVLGAPMSAVAIDFADAQKEKHPCLKAVPLPGVVPLAKAEEVPEQYRGWVGATGVLVGEWKATKLGDFCQVVLIEGIDAKGFAQVWYLVGKPFTSQTRSLAQIREVEGNQVLEVLLNRWNGVSVSYTLKKGDTKADALHSSAAKGYVELLK